MTRTNRHAMKICGELWTCLSSSLGYREDISSRPMQGENAVVHSAIVRSKGGMFAEGNLGYWLPLDATEEIDAVASLATVPRPSMVVSIEEECVGRELRA